MNDATQFFNTTAGGGGYEIERSLRFNSSDSAYLSRTPASAGNRKTWTWAGWVKNTCSATTAHPATLLFARNGAGAGVGEYFWLAINNVFTTDGHQLAAGDGNVNYLVSTAFFRDPSAWYHIACVYDSTQAAANSRLRLYVNGAEITAFNTNNRASIAQNSDGVINRSGIEHRTGLHASNYSNCYLADVHFIDGQALDPSDFGEFDANNIWQPKAYTGTYGTNGFHLPFSDNSTAAALGTDTSGNGNTWTVNNLSVQSDYDWSLNAVTAADSVSIADDPSLRLGTSDFTVEFFVNFNATTTYKTILGKGYGGDGRLALQTGSGVTDIWAYIDIPSSGGITLAPTGSPAAGTWYHYALTRQGSTFTVWVNGVSKATGTGALVDLDDVNDFLIGTGGVYPANAKISNVRVVKGTALYTTGFTPPSGKLSAVPGTVLLTLQDSTYVDNSTYSHTVTPAGSTIMTASNRYGDPKDNDSLVDSPTNGTQTDTGAGGEVVGNYATLNPLTTNSAVTLSNGNLNYYLPSGANYTSLATIGMSSGKWYCEYVLNSGANGEPGLARFNVNLNSYLGSDANGWMYNNASGYLYNNASAVTYGATYTFGDIIGIAFDADAGNLTFYKNGVSQGLAASGLTNGPFFFAVGANNQNATFNFGQRQFAFTAPSGFKALCTANLPTPTIEDGSTAMDVVLDTGANILTAAQGAIGGSADLLWIKDRANNNNHQLIDTVRGGTATLQSNTNAAETTYSAPSGSSVAWTWDAGSSTVSNTDGSITSQVRANASAGVSIATAGYFSGTVGHGLGVAPAMVIVKQRTGSNSWYVYHKDAAAAGTVANNSYLLLNTTGGVANYGANLWNVTSTTVGSNQNLITTGVYYCFAPVEGYSAFGSYTGNGSATDGPFVYTGFRPRWILIKASSSVSYGNWVLHDTSRSIFNVSDKNLYANRSNVEDSTYLIDCLGNGFKLRSSSYDGTNGSGSTYIYAAFAEHPFAYARAR